MGSSCCKDTASVQTDLNLPDGGQEKIEGEPHKIKRKVAIRRTIQSEEIGLDDADVEARQGAEDPDLDKLMRDAEKRKAAKEGEPKKRVSLTENDVEQIPRHPQAETPVASKRCKGRKGTGFVKKNDIPPQDDEGGVEIEDTAESKGDSDGRCKQRKGTGYVKKGQLPVDDEDEDDDEFPTPNGTSGASSKPQKRSKDRKGTGFIKKGMLPIDDEEDED